MTDVSKTAFLQRLKADRQGVSISICTNQRYCGTAKESGSAIILEELKGIRKLYKKGNGQGNKFRRKMNSWSFYEFQRQLRYKAAWEGISVMFADPKRTSQLCPVCGGTLEDRLYCRKLWCNNCMRLMDREVVASMNVAYKGWLGFAILEGF
jgi:putative transposase